MANFYPYPTSKTCVGDTSSPSTQASGASPYGVLDMGGNVWEWVSDFYDANTYAQCASGCTDPQGPTNALQHLMRGSSFHSFGDWLRVARRSPYHATYQGFDVGFRCAK
jgi:formylglycine-generating enzyme required for sulfatase activity